MKEAEVAVATSAFFRWGVWVCVTVLQQLFLLRKRFQIRFAG